MDDEAGAAKLDAAKAKLALSQEEHLRRINAKQAKIVELEAQLKDARGQLATMPNPTAMTKRLEKAEAARDSLQSEFDSYRSETETRQAIMAHGITDTEDMELVRWRYSRLPAEGRPDFAVWLDKGASDDRQLAALFPGDTSTDTSTDTQDKPARQGLPAVNGRVKQSTSGPSKEWSLEHIMQMSPRDRLKPENRERIQAVLDATK